MKTESRSSGDLLYRFREFIKTENLFGANDHLLLAVSGGVDSMVLCRLCFEAGYAFSIAHCNFQLRGAESDADELLVKETAANYTVDFHTKNFDTRAYKIDNKLGTQEAARNLRYEWFNQVIETIKKEKSASRVLLLTAHHASDQAETVLFNLMRGTGLRGLAGIASKRDSIRRPLLFASKEALKNFAEENNIAYREDASNAGTDYSRNYIRNELLPAAEKIFPEVSKNISNSSERFKDAAILYTEILELKIKKLVEKRGQELLIPVLKLQKMPAGKTILHEILQPCNFSSAQEKGIWDLLNAPSGKYINSSSHRVLRDRKWLIISPLETQEQEVILIEDVSRTIDFKGGQIFFKETHQPVTIEKDPSKAFLDKDKIELPLLLRKWKQGDYFYPLGMNKKKKLSRFFIDQKISLVEKEKTWVLESGKKIIWIAGHRIDDRFKVTDSTKNVLVLSLSPE